MKGEQAEMKRRTASVVVRTRLSMSPELQGMLRLISRFTQLEHATAEVLVRVGYDYGKAALFLGVSAECLRRQVFRLKERVREMMGPLEWEVPVRRRAGVRYSDPSNLDEAREA